VQCWEQAEANCLFMFIYICLLGLIPPVIYELKFELIQGIIYEY